MKNYLKTLYYCLFISLSLVSCSREYDVLQEESSFDVDEYIAYLIGESGIEKIGGPAPPLIESESDVISADEGCYTVNVRIYITDPSTGTRYLVANDNVQVGDCDEKSLFNNTKCEGNLQDGNRVLENGTNDLICLLELLNKNDVVYNLYLTEIQQYQ